MMAAVNDNHLLALLYLGLVLSATEYALGYPNTQLPHTERFERIENEAVYVVSGCTRDGSCKGMRFLLDVPTIYNRIKLSRTHAYFRNKKQTRSTHSTTATNKTNKHN